MEITPLSDIGNLYTKLDYLKNKDNRKEFSQNVFNQGTRKFKVLGQGSYGCAIFPALLFSSSKIINQSNRGFYVTKLIYNDDTEYDTAKSIEQLAGTDVGIFPVDSLECGIKLNDLNITDSNKRLLLKCTHKSLAGQYLNQTYKSFFEDTSYKRLYHDYQGRISGGAQLCAIQYPKYFKSLYEVKERDYTQTEIVFIFSSAVEKMNKLHDNFIYHCDIKPLNMCMLDRLDIRFADFGMSHIVRTNKDLREAIRLMFLYKKYYKDLIVVYSGSQNLTRLFDYAYARMNHYYNQKNETGMLTALTAIDTMCLISAIIQIFPSLRPSMNYSLLENF